MIVVCKICEILPDMIAFARIVYKVYNWNQVFEIFFLLHASIWNIFINKIQNIHNQLPDLIIINKHLFILIVLWFENG